MKTLSIEIPEGYVVDKFDPSSGVVLFKEKPKNVMERIKTIEDVLNDNGWDIDKFYEFNEGAEPDEIAYKILKLLAKSLNEGWTPDWNDDNQVKYYPWFYMGGSSGFRYYVYDRWGSGSIVGSRLCFKSRELTEYAGKQFTEVYKQFMTI